MMDAMIKWSVHNRAAVLAVGLLLCAAGGVVAMQMPVDVFPDLTAPTVTVITEAHGMAPTEVESQVTFPIEAALNGASGVRRVRSSTAVGISVVWVEFDWGTDIYAARQVVGEKLALIRESLPPEAGSPILAPVSSIMGEILFISLTSEGHSATDLRTTADTVVRRRLLAVPGVAQVTPIGGAEKQYQVILDPARLRAYDISVDQVSKALMVSNENVSAGFLVERGSEYIVTGLGRLRTTDDIADTVVTLVEGVPVKISALGTVRIGEAPKRGEGSANEKPAVVLGIQKQPGANTLALTEELDRVISDLKLEPGMKIDKAIFRQADFIEVSIRNVLHALRDGAIVVVVIVLLTLLNWRATFITLTALPLSLLTAVLTLKAMGSTINTMTLGGMAIAIGALVDDAIVDVENVFRRLRENAGRQPVMQVVYESSVEIRSSIVFATVIIALVFVPFFFLSGVEGRLLQPLGVAFVVSLFASLLVAVTITPALCVLMLPSSKAVKENKEPVTVHWLKAGYSAILSPILKYPWIVTVPAIILLGLSIYGATRLGRSFLPEFNEGSLTISAVSLPGTSLAESDKLGRIVERVLRSHPEVVSVSRRTGRAELDEHAQGVEAAELDVSLKMKERTKDEFLEALRSDLTQVPGVNITIGQPISHRIDHMLSGTRASVAVKIFGDDLYRLRTVAEKSRQAMSNVKGVVDLSVEQQMDIPTLKVHFDRTAIAHYGLQIQEVSHALEAALQGVTVTRILEGRNAFDLVVRVSDEEGWNLETISDYPVDTPRGAKVPLKLLAQVVRDTGPNTISRENVERKIVVQCNVSGVDVATVVNECRKLVDPIVNAEKGYHVEYGGQFQAAEEAGRTLLWVGIAVIVAIGFLLNLAFGSARDAVFVMLNLPLALIGGVAGVYMTGGVLSIASIIGFITVFGIATRNGIMLITHIRHLQEEEGVSDFRQAVYRGALERVSPVLMTALAAGLALIPLALAKGQPGNEILTPMAVVILSGLMSSMVLDLLVVPALYLRFGKPVSKDAA